MKQRFQIKAGHLLQEWKTQSIWKKIVDIISLLIIFAGVGVSIFMNMAGRSLWLDEAMLAYSFSKRSLFELTSSVFEWEQSAPVLYLYFAKVITLIFGNTEFVLRGVSIIAMILTLYLTWSVAHYVFRIKYALLCSAFLANMNFILQYSNVFKQYLSECVWVLLVLVVYRLYRERKITFRPVILLYMIFIWGANPACFFIGGVLACEFIEGVVKKDRAQIRNSLFIGAGVFVSFVTYYFYWLRATAQSGVMQEYWGNADFPLIPKSIEDLKMANAMLYDVFITFREGRIFIMGLVLAAFVIGIILEKNRYYMVVAMGFLITLFASFIHMFPMADRLWCFSYPLFVILSFSAIDRMMGKRSGEVAAVLLMFVLLLTNNGILVYRHAENVYWEGEEANPNIAYVQENIREDEKMYVYYHSIPVVKYKIGYDTDKIGDVAEDNIMWGADFPSKDAGAEDIPKVQAMEKCYIMASHAPAERIDPLLNALQESGNLEIVQNAYETPLYYYTSRPQDMKTGVSYEMTEYEEEDGICYVTIRVTNTGESYINTEFDNVTVACREREDVGTNLWGNLAPGQSFDMPLSFPWNDDTSVTLQLRNGDKYWYDELGFEPITITREGEAL